LEEFRAVERALAQSPYIVPPDILPQKPVDEEHVAEDAVNLENEAVDTDERIPDDGLDVADIVEEYSQPDISSPLEDPSPPPNNNLPFEPDEKDIHVQDTNCTSNTPITRMPSIQRRGQEILRQYLLNRTRSPTPIPPSESISTPDPIQPSSPLRRIAGAGRLPSLKSHSISLLAITLILFVLLLLSIAANIVLYTTLHKVRISHQDLWGDFIIPDKVVENIVVTVPSSRWTWFTAKVPLKATWTQSPVVRVEKARIAWGQTGRLERMVNWGKVFFDEIWRILRRDGR